MLFNLVVFDVGWSIGGVAMVGFMEMVIVGWLVLVFDWLERLLLIDGWSVANV